MLFLFNKYENNYFLKNNKVLKDIILNIYMILKQKGDAEIISQAIIFLIVISAVGIVTTILIPVITEQQSQQRFEIAQKNIQEIDFAIMEVLGQPTGAVVEINIILDRQLLEIIQDENKIKISHTIRGNYFEEERTQEIDSTKYNYRKDRRLFSVLEYNNISFYEDRDIENINQLKIYVKKIDKNTIDVYFDLPYIE